MEGQRSGLEVKSIYVLVSVWAISTGLGAEPRLLRSLFCREGSFPRLQQSSVLVVGRKGERERESARESPAQAQAQGAASPGGAQSIRRLGEWCEVWCLLCQGKTAVYEGWAVRPQNLSGLLFTPFFKCSQMCRRTNTDVDTIN